MSRDPSSRHSFQNLRTTAAPHTTMLPETAARPVSMKNASISYGFVVKSQADSHGPIVKEGVLTSHLRWGEYSGFYTLTSKGTSFLYHSSTDALRSRSPCASWAPPLHRGLVRGSFPAPHHHDPNEMLLNFCILGYGGMHMVRLRCSRIGWSRVVS